MSKTLHIVIGTTGEYSDRSEWLVRAFQHKNEAQSFAEACTKEAAELFATIGKYDGRSLVGKHTRDPGFYCDYTGTTYFVSDVELGE